MNGKRRKRKYYVFLSIIIIIILSWIIFAIIPPSKVIDKNPFIIAKEERTLIAAHRGGKNLNPENTLLAFDYVVEHCNVDVLEFDLCMTKDEHLVVIHDETINSCSDAEAILGTDKDYYVSDFSLDELLYFNFGAKFIDRNGNQPYAELVGIEEENRIDVIRDAKLNIVTIDEVFEAYYKSDIMFIVEIKNDGDIVKKAVDIIYSLMEEYHDSNLINRVVIGTFHNEIESYISKQYPRILRGASMRGASKFILTQMFGVNIFAAIDFACLQIPVSYKVGGIRFDLTKKTYIKRAHRRNISVQYWTINDEDMMKKLIKAGADVIMTDDPDVLYQVLIDMGYID